MGVTTMYFHDSKANGRAEMSNKWHNIRREGLEFMNMIVTK